MEIFHRSYKVLGVNVFDLTNKYGKQEASNELAVLVQSGKLKFKEHTPQSDWRMRLPHLLSYSLRE